MRPPEKSPQRQKTLRKEFEQYKKYPELIILFEHTLPRVPKQAPSLTK